MHLGPPVFLVVPQAGDRVFKDLQGTFYIQILFVCFKPGAVTVYESTYLGHSYLWSSAYIQGGYEEGILQLWMVSNICSALSLRKGLTGKPQVSLKELELPHAWSLQPAACPAEFSPTSQFLEVNPISIENPLSLFMVLYLQI